MTGGPTAPASLPPAGLPGLDPAWSRLVTTPRLDRDGRTWHVLDNGVENAEVTLLCVHGNPTWSYLWRDTITKAPSGVRVLAADQLDMGYSERTGTVRDLEQRVADLEALTDALAVKGPVVTVAHDWGGPISLGWAARHRSQLAGIVLMNTAVHQPPGAPAPRLIRALRRPAILDRAAVDSALFIRGALALSRPRMPAPIRDAYLAPYATSDRRAAIGTFVRDIPLEPGHRSADTLDGIARSLEDMGDVPVLLLWGPSDPVFSDLYLHDLEARLPQAAVHRFVGGSHLLPEDADTASAIHAWVAQRDARADLPEPSEERTALWPELDQKAEEDQLAVVEMGPDGPTASISFRRLHSDIEQLAAGLAAQGVNKGDRVALLVPPGVDLTAALYACWRMGAVVVVADAGLGLRGMGKALRSADPAYLIGVPRALAAARAMGWPGRRISTSRLSTAAALGLGAETSLEDLRMLGAGAALPEAPDEIDAAAVAFTSGATGPAKGVAYRHRQLRAQRDALVAVYDIEAEDRLVAAFAPFALYGPAMGVTSVVPAMDVTAPSTLTAPSLGAAVEAVDATMVFASPSALGNVVATSGDLEPSQRAALGGVRLLLSAGAPVPTSTLHSMQTLMPLAECHTPYGMTEVLPVADIDLSGIDTAGTGRGVCVGRPLPGVDVAISALDETGAAAGNLTTDPGIVGEVCVRADHMRDTYDRLWITYHASASPTGWHRSGDAGRFDDQGRLWVEGRLAHLIVTARGPLTPLPIERAAAEAPGVLATAAVGIGPRGAQVVAVIVVPESAPKRSSLASERLSDAVRASVDVDVAAVLCVPSLPVDLRHNAKVDRLRLARWAGDVLAGGRMKNP